MTSSPSTAPDDVAAARSLLGAANPVPDPSLDREEVLAARAMVGLAGSRPAPAPHRRGRFVVAGAVAVLSVATLIAVVVVPTQREGTVDLATGPGAQAISSAYAATAGSGTARGVLTVEHERRTVTATGVGSFDGGAARFDVALDGRGGAPGNVTVVRTNEATYARLPGGTNPLAADKPWVSVDSATLNRLMQMALGDLAAQVRGAPLDALAYLRAVSGDVQVVGPDTTRGEPTTHYRGTVDPARVTEQLPAAMRPDAARAAGRAGQMLPVDVWIDAEGRLRKLVLTADAGNVDTDGLVRPGLDSGHVPAGPVTVTVELWDFGAPVDATPPPADEVVDVSALLSGFVGGATGP